MYAGPIKAGQYLFENYFAADVGLLLQLHLGRHPLQKIDRKQLKM
jgi:hypothetical protein